MILKILNIIIKSNYRYLIILLLFASITEFFKNCNIILVRDYNERLLRSYNICNGVSYGYVNKIKSKYLLNHKKIFIINFGIYPSIISMFPDLIEDENKNDIIFLNFKNSEINQLKKLKLDLSNYTLVDVEDNCYYYKNKTNAGSTSNF
jgi:hypothetical protein